ncbi:MAG: TetR/AcrR family transcriptional regulator [Pseudomonadota bacterium]
MKASGRPVGEYDVKKREIADATWRVIAERGLEGASMRAIAREAGCTTGALVHYFEGKDEILEFALTQAFERTRQQFDDAMKQQDVIGTLRRLGKSALPLDDDSRNMTAAWQSFLAVAEKNPQMNRTVQRLFNDNHKRLTKLMKLGQSRGEIRNDLPASQLADLLNAANEGLVRIAPFEPERLSPQRLTRLINLTIEMIKS